MIAADDPRHGTYAGYKKGCDCDACSDAQYRYTKAVHVDHERGVYRTCDARGTIRRIQALQAIGWPQGVIAERAGLSSSQAVSRLLTQQQVWTSTRDAIARLFDDLSMTVPDDARANRRRGIARRKGYLPPLAWDDIDLDEEPAHAAAVPHTADEFIDENAVERALAGDRNVRLTLAERWALVARAQQLQVSLQEVERRTGLRPHRYIASAKEAA